MEKARKLYVKALGKFENGYIDEAIDICEEAISRNMKNSAAVNLKGLLYYFKGDLDGARALWKLNFEVNKDEVSKKYLHGLNEDEKRFSLYTSAIALINESNIKDALTLLKRCKESDYNSINVNNAIATCYLTIGQFDDAVTYVNKTLEIDRKNEIAGITKKNLIKNGISKNLFINKQNIGKSILVALILCLVIGISAFGINGLVNKKPEVNTAVEIDKGFKDLGMQNKENGNNINGNKDENKADIDNKEANSGEDTNTQKDAINTEKTETNVALSEEEVRKLYIKGREEANVNKNYDEALRYLLKAHSSGGNTYLYPHILYSTGHTYDNKGATTETNKYYSEYIEKFSKGDYAEEVLYRLALINKDSNISKAKDYAYKLSTNYPDSQYNNSVIKNIINQ